MVNRYDFVGGWQCADNAYMDLDRNGEYVRYEDYQKLEEENKKLKEKLKSSEAQNCDLSWALYPDRMGR